MSRPEERAGVTSPPSGNGSVPGLGEAFTINLGTGQGVYSYKLSLPDGVAGHGARLVLEYAPRRRRSAPSASAGACRCAPSPRRLDFGAPGSGRRPSAGSTAARSWSRPRTAPMRPHGRARSRATSARATAGSSRSATASCTSAGSPETGRVADPDHPERVQEWLIERSLDPSGNAVEYAYEHEDGVAYPASGALGRVRAALRLRAAPGRAPGRARRLRAHGARCAAAALELVLDPGTAAERRRALLGVRLSRGRRPAACRCCERSR